MVNLRFGQRDGPIFKGEEGEKKSSHENTSFMQDTCGRWL
jgi:hypothetical protein